MPTYEYECQECEQRFEKFQQMSDASLKTCPQCGGAVRRLIGKGGAVIVKGAGSHAAENMPCRATCGRDTPCCGMDMPCDVRPGNE